MSSLRLLPSPRVLLRSASLCLSPLQLLPPTSRLLHTTSSCMSDSQQQQKPEWSRNLRPVDDGSPPPRRRRRRVWPWVLLATVGSVVGGVWLSVYYLQRLYAKHLAQLAACLARHAASTSVHSMPLPLPAAESERVDASHACPADLSALQAQLYSELPLNRVTIVADWVDAAGGCSSQDA